VDYPNAEDRRRGLQDGRTDLGSDIIADFRRPN
jgi:hypothetical protein